MYLKIYNMMNYPQKDYNNGVLRQIDDAKQKLTTDPNIRSGTPISKLASNTFGDLYEEDAARDFDRESYRSDDDLEDFFPEGKKKKRSKNKKLKIPEVFYDLVVVFLVVFIFSFGTIRKFIESQLNMTKLTEANSAAFYAGISAILVVIAKIIRKKFIN